MSVKTITTITIGGGQVDRLVRQVERRRHLRAAAEWVLNLDPTEPPVYGHATVYEQWHPTLVAREAVAACVGTELFFSDAYEAFMLPTNRTPKEIERHVNARRHFSREMQPALTPLLADALHRARWPTLAVFTFVRSITASWADREADTSPVWRSMPGSRGTS